MIKKLNDINVVLVELMVGILFFAGLCELIGVWFVTDIGYYSLGIAIGFVLAEGSTLYMAVVLYKAMHMEPKNAASYVRFHSIFRYGIMVIVIYVLLFTEIANPLSAFLALMGIKVAAYMQPSIHKLFKKK